MSFTTKPKPGVAPNGERCIWLIGGKGSELSVIACFGGEGLREAKATACARADDYDEIVVIDGTLAYRVWDPEKPGPVVA